MWSQASRKVLISSVYEYLFWQKLDNPANLIIDWEQLIEQHYNEGDIFSPENFQEIFKKFEDTPNHYLDIISKHINDDSKTFDLVKACLIVFVIELENSTPKPPKNIISKYIRVTQDLVGGENPSLVHAIASKIFNQI